MTDADDQPLSEEERRRRWNTAVMAGSVAPRSATWVMPKSGWRQLQRMPRKARRRIFTGMALAGVLVAFCVGAVVDDHGRLAAYTVLAAFGLYVCGCALYLGVRGLASSRRRR